jgi:hypothetical protein
VSKQTEMVEMGMGNKDTQQRRITTVQSVDFGEILGTVLFCVQRQAKINNQSLAAAFDLNTTATYLFAATMYAYAHDVSILLPNEKLTRSQPSGLRSGAATGYAFFIL